MSQIKQKNKLAVKLAIAGAGIGSGLGVSQVSADEDTTVVRASTAGDGVTRYEGVTTGTTNETAVTEINEQIRNLAQSSNGLVTVDTTVIEATDVTVDDAQKSLAQLQNLINEYNTVKASLDTQASTNVELTGSTDTVVAETSVDITGSTYAEIIQKLQTQVDQLKATEVSNQKAIDTNAANSTTAERELAKAVNQANNEITEASHTVLHSNDGAVGNYDDIKRASEDSAKKTTIKTTTGGTNGVIVDNSKTQQINATTTTTRTKDVEVRTIPELEAKKQEALEAIRKAQAVNNTKTTDIGVYRDNALGNIKHINDWLQVETDRAENIQDVIEQNTTAAKNLDALQKQTIQQLTDAKAKVQSSNKPAKSKEKIIKVIDQAIAKINAAKITTTITATINEAENVDFGDIGQDRAQVTAKTTEITAKIDRAIDGAMDGMKQSNKEANDKLDAFTDAIVPQIDFLVEQVNSNKFGGNGITDEWLSGRKIYQGNAPYQSFIKKAVSLTEEDTAGVIDGPSSVMTVRSGTPTAKVAAALYAMKSEQGLSEGFGSVMLPSTNINDFAAFTGNKILNSQRDGGATSVIEQFREMIGLEGTMGTVDGLSFIQDIRNQHIGEVGDSNVLLIMSRKPTAVLTLKNAFVYLDGDGKPKTTDMTVKLDVTDENGNSVNFTDEPYGPGRLNTFYFYYASVDKKSGKLVTGAGWRSLYTGGGFTNGGGTGGTGEMALGADTDPSDTVRKESLKGELRFYTAIGDPQAGRGIRLTVTPKVNSVAGNYAKNSPTYIGDIDDGQRLHVTGDVIVSDTSKPKFVQGGVLAVRGDATSAHDGTVNLNDAAIMTTSNAPVGISHAAVNGVPYQNIDISLFSPWGVIGDNVELNIPDFKANVETFDIKNPSAVAHTEGNVSYDVPITRFRPQRDGGVERVTVGSANVVLPTLKHTPNGEKIASSSTSMIVKRKAGSDKRVASGNSFVIKTLNGNKRTSSAHSFVVRTSDKTKRTASSHSLVTRVLNSSKHTSSATSFTVKTMDTVKKNDKTVVPVSQVVIPQSITQNGVEKPVQPHVVEKNKVTLSVYADPTIKSGVEESMNAWKTALAKKNLDVDVRISSDLESLRNGVTIAFFEADNETTRANMGYATLGGKFDLAFEFSSLAGLTTTTSTIQLVDLDPEDKFNRDGTITTGALLKNTNYIIQLNTEAVTDAKRQKDVLTHEVGHIFGLDHNDSDSLMTTYYDDEDFTGEISDIDATLAAAYIVDKLK